jgi:hypothetical protein
VQQIRPKLRSGAKNAVTTAVVKLARTTNDLRLAKRRVRSDISSGSAQANTFRSKTL